MSDRFGVARPIANAILYEGYLLYPYTASSRKNQMRWQFGVVVPKAYEAAGTGEHADQHTELLFDSGDGALIFGLVRFLHVEQRSVEAPVDDAFVPVASLAVDGAQHFSFDGAMECEIPFDLAPAREAVTTVRIDVPASEDVELLHDAAGRVAGRIVRRRWALAGTITASALPADARGVRRLDVTLENDSAVAAGTERGQAMRTAFVSTHTLLGIEHGAFLSPVDPPEYAVAATEALANRRTWPVLMGDASRDAQRSPLALSSPIILGDFPAVNAGTTDHYDATEIDQLLTLSVLSLSDAERAEARATDPRARAIVERAEAYGAANAGEPSDSLFPDPRNRRLIVPTMPTAADLEVLAAGDLEPFEQLPPASLVIDGVAIEKGSTVRLAPKRRADAWDTFLNGKLATVQKIHQDFEDKIYVAVTVDDDPASDLHEWYGRAFFFEPDEVEPYVADHGVRA